jgi:hypothetical protein
MNQQTAYQLLKDINETVGRLEAKMDKRICALESRTDLLETFRDNLLGKIAIITAAISLSLTFFIDYLKDKFKINI